MFAKPLSELVWFSAFCVCTTAVFFFWIDGWLNCQRMAKWSHWRRWRKRVMLTLSCRTQWRWILLRTRMRLPKYFRRFARKWIRILERRWKLIFSVISSYVLNLGGGELITGKIYIKIFTSKFITQKVIFTILSAFICLTVQLFYLINHIRHGFHGERSIVHSTASCSLIFTHILELWTIFISGHEVKDTWNALIKRIQSTKRRFVTDEALKMRIDELVSIMVFTKVEMKAAGLFNIDLSVITSVSNWL